MSNVRRRHSCQRPEDGKAKSLYATPASYGTNAASAVDSTHPTARERFDYPPDERPGSSYLPIQASTTALDLTGL